jgi:hypothetical protein
MHSPMSSPSLHSTNEGLSAPPRSLAVTIPPAAGERFDLGGFGIHWKIDGHHSGKRFSVVHHPLAPRVLAAPLHRAQLLDEEGIGRELEAADAVRLQTEELEQAMDGALGNPGLFGYGAHDPREAGRLVIIVRAAVRKARH